MHPIVNIAVSAARNGSKIIQRSIDQMYRIKIETKSRNDFVTEVDRKVEQEIINTLLKAYPQHSILSEEFHPDAPNADYQWVIDPLDGTSNFIHGFPHFAISIAFKQRGKIEHGVIYDPVRQELFTASRGEGAYLNNRRLRVTECKKLGDALIGTGFPFKSPALFSSYIQAFQTMLPQTSDMRRAGAASLDLAYVAAGRLDGYWELNLAEWDIAAGALMVKEAGGFVSDVRGEENHLKSGDIVAGNPTLFKAMLQILQPVFALPT